MIVDILKLDLQFKIFPFGTPDVWTVAFFIKTCAYYIEFSYIVDIYIYMTSNFYSPVPHPLAPVCNPALQVIGLHSRKIRQNTGIFGRKVHGVSREELGL